MASGLVHRLRVESGIEAIVNVQANPGATIYLTESYQRPGTSASGGSTTTYEFQAVADTTTGIATITVNKPGTWYINTSVMSSTVGAVGNTASIDISESGTYSAQMVKINKGYTDCGCTNAYKSNTLLVWWNGTQPTSYWSAWFVAEADDNGNPISGTEQYGSGTVYQLSTSISYRGFLKDVSSGTTKKYCLGATVRIGPNNTAYFTSMNIVSGTAKTISLNSFVKYTSSTTVTVPEGCHSITAYAVGGGGGGGDYNNVRTKSGSYYYNYYSGCGGGGGGYQSNGSIAVVPGQTIAVTIGAGGSRGYYWISSGNVQRIGGGSGGTTSISCNGKTISASGGYGGASHNQNNVGGSSPNSSAGGSGTGSGGTGSYTNSGNGGSGKSINGTTYSGGGGGGGGYYYYDKNSSSAKFHLAGNGGSGGGGQGGGATANWSSSLNKTSTAGTANSGGGGGGGCAGATGSSLQWKGCSQPGGSGVAFITFNAA